MGNLVPALVVIIVFSLISYYLFRSLKAKGTICTSCDQCPITNVCDTESIKNELRDLIKG